MSNVTDIECIVCNAESMALVLEAALIQQYKPKYNISLRDDKSYPFIEITDEAFARICISRPRIKKGKTLFGPYPQSKTLKDALAIIRKLFPYRSCAHLPKKECLYYHIRLCPGPCIAKIDRSAYQETIDHIVMLLKGDMQKIVDALREKMNVYVHKQLFEDAAMIRDKLVALENVYYGRAQSHELLLLKELLGLSHLPLLIEAIDISTLTGKSACGSVVVFKNGQPDRSSYRRYKIKEVSRADDYAMMKEVVRRRYQRQLREKRKLPDFLLIDGGQGHVQAVKEVLKELNIDIAFAGLAKKKEELWFTDTAAPCCIEQSSPALQLLQRIRDEAHRFAHAYHIWLRKNKLLKG